MGGVKSSSTSVISQDYINHARQQFLNDDQVESFLSYCARPLRKSIRVNTLKTSVENLESIFKEYGLKLQSIPWCKEGFWVETDSSCNEPSESSQSDLVETEIQLGNLLEHLQGLFYIQEASSMLPPVALLHDEASNLDNVMVLDMAAAPGSKTTQIASMINNKGLILANEKSASRVKVLHSNLVRWGISNTCICQFDANKLKGRITNCFDYVLLDAPCSGEGTIRKDLKALEDWQLSKVEEIAQLQKSLILTAYQSLKPGGRLVYSTCTLSIEENHHVADYLVEQTDAKVECLSELFDGADLSITDKGYLHVLPQTYDSEGFFVAAFEKPTASNVIVDYPQVKSPFQLVQPSVKKRIAAYYSSHFGVDLMTNPNISMKQRDKEIWLFPKAFDLISKRVRLNRSGIKLAEVYPNKIRSTYEFAITHGGSCDRQAIHLNKHLAQEYLRGKDLYVADIVQQQHIVFKRKSAIKLLLEESKINNGEVILLVADNPIGIGSLQNGKIKNQLPRDRVLDTIELS